MRKIAKRHIVYVIAICLFYTTTKILKVGCLIKYVFGIPCPTCGVTRAMMALVRFDISSYLGYHPLALPLCLSVLFVLHLKLFRKKALPLTFIFVTVLLNTVYYLIEIIDIFS